MHDPFKPSRTLLTVALALAAAPLLHAADTQVSDGEAKARASNCFACHAIDHKLVGPSYQEVAERYAGKGDAVVKTLVDKVKVGGAGNWGSVPMTPHPELSDADITTMVKWILTLHGGAAVASHAAPAAAEKTYTYKTEDGKSVQSDVAVFTGVDQKHVTAEVFHGYEQYNSYCFRCHGGDAIGGEYAPDLRKSLAGGMTFQQFFTTAMTGRQAKGMPSWAGFFEEKDIQAIYDYVKARELDLVPPGRPPTAQD